MAIVLHGYIYLISFKDDCNQLNSPTMTRKRLLTFPPHARVKDCFNGSSHVIDDDKQDEDETTSRRRGEMTYVTAGAKTWPAIEHDN